MSIRTSTALTVVLLSALAAPVQAQAPLPAGWPNRMELGMGDSPGGAAAMKATAPFAFRYQYLAGDVTGYNWADWNPNGDFAKFYIEDSARERHHPGVHLLHHPSSRPRAAAFRGDGVYANMPTPPR